MAEPASSTPSTAATEKIPPFVTLIMDPEKGEQFLSNIKVELRPAMLWLLMWGVFQVMLGKLGPQPKSPLMTPNGNGMREALRRMGIG